jgi:hypothetical protein
MNVLTIRSREVFVVNAARRPSHIDAIVAAEQRQRIPPREKNAKPLGERGNAAGLPCMVRRCGKS